LATIAHAPDVIDWLPSNLPVTTALELDPLIQMKERRSTSVLEIADFHRPLNTSSPLLSFTGPPYPFRRLIDQRVLLAIRGHGYALS
jgi:hypothetical protein